MEFRGRRMEIRPHLVVTIRKPTLDCMHVDRKRLLLDIGNTKW